jgi:hypothetical protein
LTYTFLKASVTTRNKKEVVRKSRYNFELMMSKHCLSHWKICHYLYISLAYLGVALPAVGADVGLHMLRILVLGDVLKQSRLFGEALVAGVALVGLV